MKKAFFLVITVFCTIAYVYSQPIFDEDVTDVTIPVDGGIITVVGSAMVYGFYKNRKQKP